MNCKQHHHQFRLETGDKVLVMRGAEDIKWVRNGKVLCEAVIPGRLVKVELFPVCWIQSLPVEEHITRLKFS